MKWLAFIFGCSHNRFTWPRGKEGSLTVTCTDCGATIPYSWPAPITKPSRDESQSTNIDALRLLNRL